jgi:hypothetical protein
MWLWWWWRGGTLARRRARVQLGGADLPGGALQVESS